MKNIGTFLFFIIVAFVLWEALHIALPVLFPDPLNSFKVLFFRFDLILYHYPYTMFIVLGGIVMSVLFAFSFTAFFQLFPYLDASFFPWLVTFQAIPITIGPLMLGIFGSHFFVKICIVALLGYFPVFLVLNNAMRNVDRDIIKAFQAMSFSSFKIFFSIRIPATIPHLFIGIRGSLCWIISAAILTEFLGAKQGLGFLVETAILNLDIEMVFAVLIVISFSGFFLHLFLKLIQKIIIPWHKGNNRYFI